MMACIGLQYISGENLAGPTKISESTKQVQHGFHTLNAPESSRADQRYFHCESIRTCHSWRNLQESERLRQTLSGNSPRLLQTLLLVRVQTPCTGDLQPTQGYSLHSRRPANHQRQLKTLCAAAQQEIKLQNTVDMHQLEEKFLKLS